MFWHFCCSSAWRWGCYGVQPWRRGCHGFGEAVSGRTSAPRRIASRVRPRCRRSDADFKLHRLTSNTIIKSEKHELVRVRVTLHEAGVNCVCSQVSSFKSVCARPCTCSRLSHLMNLSGSGCMHSGHIEIVCMHIQICTLYTLQLHVC